METIRGMAGAAGDDKAFEKYLHSLGCTHLLVRYDLFRNIYAIISHRRLQKMFLLDWAEKQK